MKVYTGVQIKIPTAKYTHNSLQAPRNLEHYNPCESFTTTRNTKKSNVSAELVLLSKYS